MSELFGSTKDGYCERIARVQADLILKDFDNGVDPYKAMNRANHRLAKIERRTNEKTVKKIKNLMTQYIKQSPQMAATKAKQQGINQPKITDMGNGMVKMTRPKPLLFVPSDTPNPIIEIDDPAKRDYEAKMGSPLLFGADGKEIIKGRDY